MRDQMPKIEAAQEARSEALRGVERAERDLLSQIERFGALESAIAGLCEASGISDHYNLTAAPADFRDGRTTRDMVASCVKRRQADANKSEGWAFRSLAQEAESISGGAMAEAQAARSERAWSMGAVSSDAMDRAEALNSLETQLYDYRKAQTAHLRYPDDTAPARMPKDLERALARKVVADFGKNPDAAVVLYKANSQRGIAEIEARIAALAEAKGVASRAALKVKHVQKGQRDFLERATADIEPPREGYGPQKEGGPIRGR